MITRIIFLILVWSTIVTDSNGQTLIYTDKYKFLGYVDEQPIFSIYEKEADTRAFYTLEKHQNLFGFRKLSEFPGVYDLIFFVQDDITVGGSWESNLEGYRVSVFKQEKLMIEVFMKYSPKCVYNNHKNFLFLFVGNDPGKEQILSFDFNSSPIKPITLPLKGYRGYTVDDWLYFSYYHENNDYSPYPDDIFRVKIGDWLNPELVLTSDEFDNWFLYPEEHIIATDIDLEGKEINENNQILYNVDQQAYAVVPNIKTNRSSTSAYLKYEGNYYGYFKLKDNAKGLETISLSLLPQLPNSYPKKDGNDVLPREAWYNLPITEKTFDSTFITQDLLREASTQKLSELSKAQLRLLRNAIYAQYGYIFNSNDLKDFFGQFEWYRMITVKKVDNEDVVLLPKDKERAELIREIENGM